MVSDITPYGDTAGQLQTLLDALRGGGYEAYVSAGRDVCGAQNRNRVLLAELSRIVGDDDRFSHDISDGNIEARTLRDYRHVVDYYGGPARVCRYLDHGAGWKVMSFTAGHFGDSGKDEAYAYIEHTLTYRTTYREAVKTLRAGQPPTPTLAEQVTAAYKRLRDAVDGVPELLEGAIVEIGEEHWRYTTHGFPTPEQFRAKAQAIRDALSDRVGAAVAVRVTEAG